MADYTELAKKVVNELTFEEGKKFIKSLRMDLKKKVPEAREKLATILAFNFNTLRTLYSDNKYTSAKMDDFLKEQFLGATTSGSASQLATLNCLHKEKVGVTTYYTFTDTPIHKDVLFNYCLRIWNSTSSYQKKHYDKKRGISLITPEEAVGILKKQGYRVLKPIVNAEDQKMIEALKAKGYENLPEPKIEYNEI